MANNELGEVRRSSVLMNYGPGAIVNFSVGTAPVSVISEDKMLGKIDE